MAVRKDGRWGNTQENAHAMEALVAYYRKYEPTVPDFRGVVIARRARARARGLPRPLGRGVDRQRADDAGRWRPAAGRTDVPLTFTREGTGTLFYSDAPALRRRRALPGRARRRLPHRAALRAVRRERQPAGGDDVTPPAISCASRSRSA